MDHYVRARPSYPQAFLDFLRDELNLRPHHVLADVGSGTGILTRSLVALGNPVFAVEPNAEMRYAAEEMLKDAANFHSVNGTAEATTLPVASVDFILAAQAFHWFDPPKTKTEFRRILRPGGKVILVWNDRRTHGSAFAEAYERFIQQFNHEPDVLHCKNVTRTNEQVLHDFFAPAGPQKRIFPNAQHLDFEGLKARVLSSSYMPMADSPRYPEMIDAMTKVFQENATNGTVTLDYDTVCYWGPVGA